MRSATVVLPVPGLPVKLMCRLGACACRPRFMRSLSLTVRASVDGDACAAAASAVGSATGVVAGAVPGIEYSGEPMSGHLARRRWGDQVHGATPDAFMRFQD